MRNIIKEIETTKKAIINELIGSGFGCENTINNTRLEKNNITVVIPNHTDIDDEIMFKRTAGDKINVLFKRCTDVIKDYPKNANYLTHVMTVL